MEEHAPAVVVELLDQPAVLRAVQEDDEDVTRVERFDRRGTEPIEPFEPFELFQNRNFS